MLLKMKVSSEVLSLLLSMEYEELVDLCSIDFVLSSTRLSSLFSNFDLSWFSLVNCSHVYEGTVVIPWAFLRERTGL